jgi:hypothetical protein
MMATNLAQVADSADYLWYAAMPRHPGLPPHQHKTRRSLQTVSLKLNSPGTAARTSLAALLLAGNFGYALRVNPPFSPWCFQLGFDAVEHKISPKGNPTSA